MSIPKMSFTIHGPHDEGFYVYGGPDTNRRAIEWATKYGYALVDGVSACAHGLAGLACPTWNHCHHLLDHSNMWVPADGNEPTTPFVLAANYAAPAGLKAYTEAWGVTASPTYPGDDWYGAGTTPIRLYPPSLYLWPLEQDLIVETTIHPVRFAASA